TPGAGTPKLKSNASPRPKLPRKLPGVKLDKFNTAGSKPMSTSKSPTRLAPRLATRRSRSTVSPGEAVVEDGLRSSVAARAAGSHAIAIAHDQYRRCCLMTRPSSVLRSATGARTLQRADSCIIGIDHAIVVHVSRVSRRVGEVAHCHDQVDVVP